MSFESTVGVKSFEARIRQFDFDTAQNFSEALLYRALKIFGIELDRKSSLTVIHEDKIDTIVTAIVREYEKNREHINTQANAICENFILKSEDLDPLRLRHKQLFPGMLCEYLMKYVYENPSTKYPPGFLIFTAIVVCSCINMYRAGLQAFLSGGSDAITRSLLTNRENVYKFGHELFVYATDL